MVCIIVLLLVWVGAARVSALAVALMVFPPVYFNCLEGLLETDDEMQEMLDAQVSRHNASATTIGPLWHALYRLSVQSGGRYQLEIRNRRRGHRHPERIGGCWHLYGKDRA